MAASIYLSIAQAIVQELVDNQEEFNLPYSPQLLFDSEQELEDLETFRVDVVPGDKKSDAAGRAGRVASYLFDIALRRKVDMQKDLADQLDELVAFAESIEKWFADPPRRLTNYEAASFSSPAEVRYPYLASHLRTKNQYTCLLRLTYRTQI